MRWSFPSLIAASAIVLSCSGRDAELRADSPGDSRQVQLQLTGGRTISGVLDARSDDRLIWLRSEESNLVFAASASWGDVQAASLDGQAIDPTALREQAPSLKTTGAEAAVAETVATSPAVADPRGRTLYEIINQSGGYGARPSQMSYGQRVRNLEIVDVRLANWDRDVEPDGLEVSIVAVGYDGEAIGVRGNLTAELVGERRELFEPGVEFSTLGRWAEPVHPGHFVDGVATYKFRFRTTAPEWEFDLLPDAILTMRLGAFGEGNYAASAPVLVRKFNPMRDNLQQGAGTRFLREELSGRRPLNRFGPQQGLWQWWPR